MGRCTRIAAHVAICLPLVVLLAGAVAPAAAFVHFESPPVHPIELAPGGNLLFAVHTMDQRLVVFDVTGPSPVRVAEIPVGVEPVTVRARTNDEVWVVNHVSDDISIVKPSEGNVVRTLLVGDEPTDVVFAGNPQRAFVCVSQEDRLLVFDPANLDAPPISVPLAASSPRSLAVSLDGSTVFVTALDSGNLTTVVSLDSMRVGPPAPPPSIPMDPGLPPPPVTALIVRYDGTHWVDETGTSWDARVPYQVLDHDVVKVDVATETVTGTIGGVGTSLFNVAVNPADGTLLVTNQHATNDIRFEPVLSGRFVKSRATSVDPVTGVVTQHDLNGHIDYGNPAGNPVERSLSLGLPTDVTFSADGATAYVAAYGSAKVGVLDASGNVIGRYAVADGPAGLALDEARGKLYVLARIAAALSVVDLGTGMSSSMPLGHDPRPAGIREGEVVFYNCENSSAHGDLACASCHVFGNTDYLAWDLGNPQGAFQLPPPPVPGDSLAGFHPMKGAMTTQTFRGLPGTEPFHWRGDRGVLSDFNPAFVSLLGRADVLSPTEMARFQDFVFSIVWEPNPYLKLDGSLPSTVAGGHPTAGRTFFETSTANGGGSCGDCHSGVSGAGAVRAGARVQALSNQDMKVPHLRGLFEKTRFTPDAGTSLRGFGTTHNGGNGHVLPHQLQLGQPPGAISAPFETELRRTGESAGALSLTRQDVEAYLLCYDTQMHPVVGAQWTMNGTNEAAGITRLNTMISVADLADAGLIAKGRDGTGQARGWVYLGGGSWNSDRYAEPPTTTSALLALAGAGREITFTGVIPGTQWRLGVDRDEDGYRDRDELDGGSDPGDPGSVPSSVGAPQWTAVSPAERLRVIGANPARELETFAFALSHAGAVRLDVYDVAGRLVRPLVDRADHPAGRYEAVWNLRGSDGRPVAGGIYFVRLKGPDGRAVQRVAVLK